LERSTKTQKLRPLLDDSQHPGHGGGVCAERLVPYGGLEGVESIPLEAPEVSTPSVTRSVRAIRSARRKVPGLPEGFRFHDLRHYLASLLIASGADVKVVQARLRHASAKTTLDTYGHLWPDADESTRAAVGAVLAARADWLRTMVHAGGQIRRSEARSA
jgi:Phage integrase family